MNKRNDLLKYASMATQFLVAIAFGLWPGIKADEQMKNSMPVLSWLLPLLIIAGLMIKIARDTSPK